MIRGNWVGLKKNQMEHGPRPRVPGPGPDSAPAARALSSLCPGNWASGQPPQGCGWTRAAEHGCWAHPLHAASTLPVSGSGTWLLPGTTSRLEVCGLLLAVLSGASCPAMTPCWHWLGNWTAASLVTDPTTSRGACCLAEVGARRPWARFGRGPALLAGGC